MSLQTTNIERTGSVRAHALAEAFAILRTGGSFDDAAKQCGLSPIDIEAVWNARQPEQGQAVNPLAHEQSH